MEWGWAGGSGTDKHCMCYATAFSGTDLLCVHMWGGVGWGGGGVGVMTNVAQATQLLVQSLCGEQKICHKSVSQVQFAEKLLGRVSVAFLD